MRTVNGEPQAAIAPAVDAHRADRFTKLFRNVGNPYSAVDTVFLLRLESAPCFL